MNKSSTTNRCTQGVFHLGLLFGIATFLGCGSIETNNNQPGNDSTSIEILASIDGLRAHETVWDKGDAIGVFAVRHGQILGATTRYGTVDNARYTTADGDGRFTASGQGITLSESGDADVVAYYPFSPEAGSYTLNIDLSDQSNPSKLDLLRGKTESPLNTGSRTANLIFGHEMAQAVFSIKTTNTKIDLSKLSVALDGLTTSAVYDIPTGTFVLGQDKASIKAYVARTSTTTQAIRTLFLLPGTDLGDARITFSIGSRKVTFTPKAARIEKGKKYTFHAEITATKGTDLTVEATVDESKIPNGDPIPLYPDSEGDTPTPPADPTKRAAYAEIPIPTRNHGNTELIMHMAEDRLFGDNYTTPGGEGKRRNYTIYFSKDSYQPLFVAYPLYKSCMLPKRGERTNDWNWDPKLANKWQVNLTKTYRTGYSRGHMMASADRIATSELNKTTFYFTNMVPQDQSQNSGVWQNLEKRAQDLAQSDPRVDTLYIVCGPILPKEDVKTVTDIDGEKRIPVPTYTYKVILSKDKKDGKWHSMGVRIPNTKGKKNWVDFMVPVKSLEKELGFTFFTHLDPSIADEVKSQVDPDYWKK